MRSTLGFHFRWMVSKLNIEKHKIQSQQPNGCLWKSVEIGTCRWSTPRHSLSFLSMFLRVDRHVLYSTHVAISGRLLVASYLSWRKYLPRNHSSVCGQSDWRVSFSWTPNTTPSSGFALHISFLYDSFKFSVNVHEGVSVYKAFYFLFLYFYFYF